MGRGQKASSDYHSSETFVLAAPPLWPDRVWHMLQWRLTGKHKRTSREVLPWTYRHGASSSVRTEMVVSKLWAMVLVFLGEEPFFFLLFVFPWVILLIDYTNSCSNFHLHLLSDRIFVFCAYPSPSVHFCFIQTLLSMLYVQGFIFFFLSQGFSAAWISISQGCPSHDLSFFSPPYCFT